MFTTNKWQTWAFLAGLTVFTIVGLMAGSPRSISFDSFGDLLRGYASDMKTQIILGAIFTDVLTGVWCAIRLGIFDVQRVAAFYKTNILPYLGGFLVLWIATYYGWSLSPLIADVFGSAGYGMVMTALSGSIFDNIQRARLGASAPEDVVMVDVPVIDPKG